MPGIEGEQACLPPPAGRAYTNPGVVFRTIRIHHCLVIPNGFPIVQDDFPVVPDGFPVIPNDFPVIPDDFPVIPDSFPVVSYDFPCRSRDDGRPHLEVSNKI